jgi:hypothetical protein
MSVETGTDLLLGREAIYLRGGSMSRQRPRRLLLSAMLSVAVMPIAFPQAQQPRLLNPADKVAISTIELNIVFYPNDLTQKSEFSGRPRTDFDAHSVRRSIRARLVALGYEVYDRGEEWAFYAPVVDLSSAMGDWKKDWEKEAKARLQQRTDVRTNGLEIRSGQALMIVGFEHQRTGFSTDVDTLFATAVLYVQERSGKLKQIWKKGGGDCAWVPLGFCAPSATSAMSCALQSIASVGSKLPRYEK